MDVEKFMREVIRLWMAEHGIKGVIKIINNGKDY